MESEGGLASLIGYADGSPYRSRTSIPDPVLGATAAVAVATALARSLTTGIGVHVDLAMIEATMALPGPATLAWTALRTARQGTCNLSWEGAPEGCYRYSDANEWVALSVRDSEEWQSLCAVISRAELAFEPAYATPEARRTHTLEIDSHIEA